MTNAIAEYEALVVSLSATEGVVTSQMFGKACLKVNGKAFLAQHQEWIVFKLGGVPREKALSYKGAELWDPSGKGRPMKEWVAVPANQKGSFKVLAEAALNHVATA